VLLAGCADVVLSGPVSAQAASTGATNGADYPSLTWSWLNFAMFALVVAAAAIFARTLLEPRRQAARLATGDENPDQSRESAITGEPLRRLWPVALLFAVVTVFILLATNWGWWVADNRFIWYWNPSRALASGMTAWDSQANLGGPAGGQGQLFVGVLGLLRLLGSAPWLVERLSHAALLFGGASGVAYLTREFAPRSRIAPVVAGAWWLAAPYTLTFLIPSSLYVNAAVFPWLMFAMLRGVTSQSRWRWAAVFTLLIALSGWNNPPGMVWAALPLIPLAAYLLFTGRTTGRAMVRWTFAAGLLTALTVLSASARSGLTAANLAENLAISESAEAVSQSSSWSESLRGLGFWLAYWNPGGKLALPQVTGFLNVWPVVALSFVPIVVAFSVVAFSRFKGRLFLGTVLLLAGASMVGGYPFMDPSPLGRFLLTLYREIPVTFAMRNSYKAGPGLLLATSVLFGLGVYWFAQRAKSHRWLRSGSLVAVGLVIVIVGQPLINGALYSGTNGLQGDIPDYWYETAAWVDQQPAAGRVLIVPSVASAVYQWGRAPDGDLVSSLFSRPYVLSQPLSNATADTANLVRALGNDLSSGNYQIGAIGPIARRLGISYLVIRNDLDWRALRIPRPSQLNSLRFDPDLRQVARFGERGENVLQPTEDTVADRTDALLPPVEVYRITGETEPIRAVTAAPSLLVSGDGVAWPRLARAGLLSSLGTVRYTARQSPEELSSQLQEGASVAITDTNARSRSDTRTLLPGPILGALATGRVSDLYGVPGSQSVLTYPDAEAVEEVDSPILVSSGSGSQARAAVDNDPATSWLTGGILPLVRQGLQVRFKGPREISQFSVTSAVGLGTRRVVGVRLEFPDGTSEDFSMAPGPNSYRFPARLVDEVTIRVTALLGTGAGLFGLSDARFAGVDLNPVVQAPDDLFRQAEASDVARRALETAPLSYRFQRATASNQEPELRRRFRVAGSRRVEGIGTLTLARTAPDAQVSRLLGTSRTAVASTRLLDQAANGAALTTDGDLATSWAMDAAGGGTVELGFPSTLVESVDVLLDGGSASAVPSIVRATVGGQTVSAPVPPTTSCPAGGGCAVNVRLRVSPTVASTATVRIVPGATDESPPSQELAVTRVLEIGTNGVPNPTIGEFLPSVCHSDLAVFGGVPIGARLERATEAELLLGRPVAVEICSDLVLEDGWHEVTSSLSAPLDELVLTALDGRNPITARAVPVDVIKHGNASIQVSVPEGRGTQLVTGLSYDQAWQASGGTSPLGKPVELDTQTAWILDEPGSAEVEASYGPQRVITLLSLLSVLMLAVAVVLAVADPPTRLERSSSWATRESRWRVLFDVFTVVFGFAVGGFGLGLLVAAAVYATRRRPRSRAALGAIVVALLVAAVVFSVPPLGPMLNTLNPLWVQNRSTAHRFSEASAVMLMVAINAATVVKRPRRRRFSFLGIERNR